MTLNAFSDPLFARLKKARGSSTQGRLDSFFKITPSENSNKRPAAAAKGKDAKKAKSGGGANWKKKK